MIFDLAPRCLYCKYYCRGMHIEPCNRCCGSATNFRYFEWGYEFLKISELINSLYKEIDSLKHSTPSKSAKEGETMKTKTLPPTEIFDVLHAAECAGVEVPKIVDDWWEQETAYSQGEPLPKEYECTIENCPVISKIRQSLKDKGQGEI